MRLDVLGKIAFAGKGLGTQMAAKRPLAAVCPQVVVEVLLAGKRLGAQVAIKRALPAVRSEMRCKRALIRKRLFAQLTGKRSLSTVDVQVCGQVAFPAEHLSAQVTSVPTCADVTRGQRGHCGCHDTVKAGADKTAARKQLQWVAAEPTGRALLKMVYRRVPRRCCYCGPSRDVGNVDGGGDGCGSGGEVCGCFCCFVVFVVFVFVVVVVVVVVMVVVVGVVAVVVVAVVVVLGGEDRPLMCG